MGILSNTTINLNRVLLNLNRLTYNRVPAKPIYNIETILRRLKSIT